MSVHLFDGAPAGLPAEAPLLAEVTLRLIEDSERERFDEELTTKHYLKNATAVGRVLRYVAEYRDQWVSLVVFNSPAFHLKLRDQWLHWSARQVRERRHLVAQNTLADRGSVLLTVVDVLGRTVATLVNTSMTAGSHEVLFDATRFSSGVYFCRLQSGSSVAVRRLLLVR